jgi:hypothetical protein
MRCHLVVGDSQAFATDKLSLRSMTASVIPERYGGFLKWGVPQKRWMVDFMENPIL